MVERGRVKVQDHGSSGSEHERGVVGGEEEQGVGQDTFYPLHLERAFHAIAPGNIPDMDNIFLVAEHALSYQYALCIPCRGDLFLDRALLPAGKRVVVRRGDNGEVASSRDTE